MSDMIPRPVTAKTITPWVHTHWRYAQPHPHLNKQLRLDPAEACAELPFPRPKLLRPVLGAKVKQSPQARMIPANEAKNKIETQTLALRSHLVATATYDLEGLRLKAQAPCNSLFLEYVS